MLFTEFNLDPRVMRGIEEAGFTHCTPVQELTLQKTLAGTDVYVQSQTGTGKTAAFLITMFHLFLTSDKYRHKKALVLTPTRELAVQVEQDALLLGKYCGLKTGCFYGGVGYATQDRLLKEDINIYIGTPGRLIDYQKSGKIDFLKFEILVIDEADRMFDMGFIPDIRFMLRRMVPPARRLTMLYSATLSQRVKFLAWEYMNDPVEIEINPEQLTVDLITQELYHIGKEEKFNLLLGILRTEKPKSVLIFTNMKRTAERVSRRLNQNGIQNDYISGDLPQKQRLKIIDAIKAGKTEILVATDVAARGLHIEDLDMVINYDLPQDSQNYVHRIGRTARAGKTGKSISLACEEDVYNLDPIEKLIGMKIPTKWPEDSLIVEATGAPIHTHRDRSTDRRNKKRGERQQRKGREKTRPAAADPPRREERGTARAGDTRRAAGSEPRRGQARPKHAVPGANKPAPAAAGTGADSRPSPDKKGRQRRKKRHDVESATRERMQHRPGPPKSTSRGKESRLSRDATPEERLDYFRKKYGDNFEKTSSVSGGDRKTKPRTLIESIVGIFKKEKK
ncbi:MAG: hypothetical protein A2176_06020 [Spirochaetes bacterium RBG_13_51_14]|nr:MAG: hypothetical protein A2176_06020 [Spirochaetes bacterium RBG_13_51_14]